MSHFWHGHESVDDYIEARGWHQKAHGRPVNRGKTSRLDHTGDTRKCDPRHNATASPQSDAPVAQVDRRTESTQTYTADPVDVPVWPK